MKIYGFCEKKDVGLLRIQQISQAQIHFSNGLFSTESVFAIRKAVTSSRLFHPSLTFRTQVFNTPQLAFPRHK